MLILIMPILKIRLDFSLIYFYNTKLRIENQSTSLIGIAMPE